jgi:hypothetical protein
VSIRDEGLLADKTSFDDFLFRRRYGLVNRTPATPPAGHLEKASGGTAAIGRITGAKGHISAARVHPASVQENATHIAPLGLKGNVA